MEMFASKEQKRKSGFEGFILSVNWHTKNKLGTKTEATLYHMM